MGSSNLRWVAKLLSRSRTQFKVRLSMFQCSNDVVEFVIAVGHRKVEGVGRERAL